MIGKTLNHYEIIEPLGAGGMGEVYLAEDTSLDRQRKRPYLKERPIATGSRRLKVGPSS